MAKPMVFLTTRIAGFRVFPSVVFEGGTVEVSGKLLHHIPLLCTWRPVSGETVKILVNGETQAQLVTAENGEFHTKIRFDKKGTYRVKAYYPGSLLYKPCETHEETVTVIGREQTPYLYLALAILAATTAAIPVTIYLATRK